jgi:RimJ/RimL family protein N-acetyltransferase
VLRPAYPIVTERLLLRPFRPDDLDALHAIQSRPDVTRYLYWDVRSRDEVAAELEARARRTELAVEGDRLVLALELRGSGELIGDVNLQWLSREHRQGEIGFVLHPDHHGQGYAAEAAVVLLALGFDELGLHRIVGRCDGRNAASARLLEKLGMRREAHLRENEVVKGEWTDELVYAMLDREWGARCGRASRADD